MQSIPASQFVQSIPAVLTPGGAPLSLNAVFLTQDPSIPIGTVQGFPSPLALSNWFGPNAPETLLGTIYFGGFTGSDQLPSTLWLTQYNLNPVAAYIRGGSVAGISLAALQAMAGTITIAIDGRTVQSANINLASATSFSSAAGLIQTGIQSLGGIFNGTASIASGSLSVLNVTAVGSGTLHVGDVVVGPGLSSGTTIASFGTGLGGIGTYNLSAPASGAETAQNYTVSSIATCTYDSLRQAFEIATFNTGASQTIAYPTDTSLSPQILLTQATGAVLSQGAAAATPNGAMNNIVQQTQNWATFMTVWEPPLATKELFAAWVNGQNERYCYVCFDSDVGPTNGNDPAAFAQVVANDNGVVPIWNPDGTKAAFFCGAAASIDFDETNGAITFAYKSQAGLTPEVTSQTVYQNLVGNGYNCYANVATSTQQFQYFQRGSITGAWLWADAYINQIYWNAAFVTALMSLLTQVKSIPYDPAGYNMIREALSPVIQAMGNFGAWDAGVVLSGSQIAAVNSAAGITIAPTLQTQGWYLQIEDPGPTVRAQRGTPIINFWYVYGGSVQQIVMNSIALE